MSCLPNPPKLFRCRKCNVYFYTFSNLEKPTHPKCHGHDTVLATKEELKEIKQANKLNNSTESDERGHCYGTRI